MGSLVIALSLLAVAAGSPATSQAQVLTGPTTTIDSGPEDPIPTSDSTPTFGFSSSDPLASLACLVDGGSFSPCSSPWTVGPLTDGPHTFQAQATDALGNPGPPASRSFTVDTTGPSVTIDSGPQGPTSDSTPTFAFSPSETEASLECRIDSASFSSCSSPFTASTLSDGAHTFDVRATDSLGNVGSVASRSFTVDTIGPSVTISSGPQDPNPTSDSTPSFSFSPSETGASLECRIDSASFSSCSSPFTASTLSEGAHTFEVRASDALGNVGPVASRSFTVDTAGPSVTIDSGPQGPTSDSTPTFAFSPSETGASLECRVDSASFSSCSSPFTASALSDGAHTFDVRAIDSLGNVGSVASRSFTVDTIGPSVTISSGPQDPNPTSDSTPSFSFSASETGASLECRIDSASFSSCSSPFTASTLSEGAHTFEVRASDALGNVGPVASRSFTVDTAVPHVDITGGPDGPTNDSSPTFTFAGGSGWTFECQLDGATVGCSSGSFTPGSSLQDGTHTFRVRATNQAGTTGPFTTRTFTVDTVAPNSSLTGGPRGPTSDSTPTFAFASEPGASFQCKVDAGSFTDCTSPRTLGPLPNGPHTFAVRARDAAGNQDASPASASFVVDTTPPQTVITSGPPASSTDGTPTFAFQASEGGAKLECSLDGSGFSACTSPSTFGPLPAGQHGFAVRARDAAGNVDASPASLAFTIVAPASSQPPPDDGRAKAFAAALVLGLKRVVGRLGSSELPAVLGRRGVTLRRVEVLAQGTVRVTAKVRRGPSRGATVLRGSRRFETAGKGSLRLRLTRAGRRLFRLARRVRLTVTYTYTAPSGTRLTASERVSMWRIYLTLREVAGVARRGIRHYFGDRPVSLTLRDCTRSGPTRVYCRHVLWRHAGRWWYARLRVRETATGLRRSMSNAYSF